MNLKRSIAIFLCIGVILSCSRKVPLRDLDFNVMADSLTISAGSKATFAISGNADFITFYSGEQGNNYEFINRTEIPHGKAYFQFRSNASTALWTLGDSTDIAVMVSTDFTGRRDSASIKAATWKNIRDSIKGLNRMINAWNYYPGPVLAQNQAGWYEFTHLLVPGKPIYFAFVYQKRPDKSLQWYFKEALFRYYTNADSTLLVSYDMTNLGIGAISLKNSLTRWATTNSGLNLEFRLARPTNPEAISAESEAWAITKALNFTSIPPDKGLPIKGILNNELTSYEYIYNTPGTYNVVFVAANENLDGRKEVIKKVIITVK